MAQPDCGSGLTNIASSPMNFTTLLSLVRARSYAAVSNSPTARASSGPDSCWTRRVEPTRSTKPTTTSAPAANGADDSRSRRTASATYAGKITSMVSGRVSSIWAASTPRVDTSSSESAPDIVWVTNSDTAASMMREIEAPSVRLNCSAWSAPKNATAAANAADDCAL